MPTWLWIALPIVLVVVIIAGYCLYRRDERLTAQEAAEKLEYQRQKVAALVELMETAKTDPIARQSLAKGYETRSTSRPGYGQVAKWSTDPELKTRLSALVAQHYDGIAYDNHKRGIGPHLTSWQRSHDVIAAAHYIYKFNAKYRDRLLADLGLSPEEAKQQVTQYLTDESTRLLATAPNDLADLLSLQQLIRDSSDQMVVRVGIATIPYPRGWNQWVAQLMRRPAVADFCLRRQEGVSYGQIANFGVDAMKKRNLTQVQIALAYCNQGGSQSELGIIRKGVGDDIYEQLVTFVANNFPVVATAPEAADTSS